MSILYLHITFFFCTSHTSYKQKNIKYLSFGAWCISLNIMASSWILFVAKYRISFLSFLKTCLLTTKGKWGKSSSIQCHFPMAAMIGRGLVRNQESRVSFKSSTCVQGSKDKSHHRCFLKVHQQGSGQAGAGPGAHVEVQCHR